MFIVPPAFAAAEDMHIRDISGRRMLPLLAANPATFRSVSAQMKVSVSGTKKFPTMVAFPEHFLRYEILTERVPHRGDFGDLS